MRVTTALNRMLALPGAWVRDVAFGGLRCVIECRLRRLYCAGCGDVYEAVPWATAGSRYKISPRGWRSR